MKKILSQITFWRAVLVVLLGLGLYATYVRFSQGLGAATNLSDQFPWGLWIGFDILCGVGLAAGGFTLCAIVYIFNLKDFKPIVRPAVLTAFLGWMKAVREMRAITIPLVIIGVLLSTLHQSSLGSLYLIVPEKLHPLWYSSLLPAFFFISAIGAGCAMVIFESFMSSRVFKRHIEMPLLSQLGRVLVVILLIYTVMKIQDLRGWRFP